MADDNRNHGYRANDPYGRARPGAAAQPSNDPLAELARLIGQQNDASPSYRQNGAWPQPPQDHWPAPEETRPAAAGGYASPSAYPDRYAAPVRPDDTPGDDPYADRGYAPASYGQTYGDPRYGEPIHHAPQFVDQRYGEASGYPASPAGIGGSAYADPQPYPDGYDRQTYGHAPTDYAHAPADYDSQPGFNAAPFARGGQQGYGDPYYGHAPQAMSADDHAPARKRGGIVTVLAVLALAVVGTAAAFGYRAMFGSSGTPMPPPVIKADTKPTKIVPAVDANAKPIQDRIGVKTERIVSREEQPVELRDPSKAASTRVIFPHLAGQNQTPTQTVANIAPAGAGPVVGATEPKKVRTVAIRPDQPFETASARPGTPARPAAEAETPRSTPAPRAQAAPPASGPLPLSPAAQSQLQPQRQAARTVNSGSPFPTPISSGGNAVAGAYAVQVTSQRSEADAQAAYRSLQTQFPSVLGSRRAVIRRADLGEKGTYYRAQVGPFGSQSEASEFCSSLKAAGGQCVVQRN